MKRIGHYFPHFSGLFLAFALSQVEAGDPVKTPAPKKPVVTIKWRAPKSGDEFREHRETGLTVKGILTINGKEARKIDQKRTLNADKTVKILAAKKGLISKVTVTYKKQVLETSTATGAPAKDTRLQAKTFSISKTNAHFTILTESGKAVDAETAELVQGEEAHLFSKTRLAFARALAARKWRFGESIKLEKDDAASLLGDKDQLKLDTVTATLTLRRSKNVGSVECLVFEVDLKGHSEEYGMKTSLRLTGDVTLEASTARLRSLTLKGPINVGGTQGGQGQVIVFKSTGQMTIHQKID